MGTLFSDGLMALLEPEAWNATSRVYSLRPLKYDAWTVSANLLGTFDYLTQYNTGVLQTREIHFGDQNEITSITDVSWNGDAGCKSGSRHRSTPLRAPSS